jgi:hypothetical protein
LDCGHERHSNALVTITKCSLGIDHLVHPGSIASGPQVAKNSLEVLSMSLREKLAISRSQWMLARPGGRYFEQGPVGKLI